MSRFEQGNERADSLIRQYIIERGEEDDPEYKELRAVTPCPECRGRCEDKYGRPCEWCHGEGEV